MSRDITDFEALKRWNAISEEDRRMLVGSIFCSKCFITKAAPDFTISLLDSGDILLKGRCSSCGEEVSRVIEHEWYDKRLGA